MLASREWTEWHLTPQGWIKGVEQTDFSRTDRPAPESRVITCIYDEHVGFSSPHISADAIWTVRDKSIIMDLSSKFGDCPNHL